MPELAGSHKAIVGSKYLAKLYKVKGASEDFDGVAPHPYGATLDKVSGQVEKYRKVMKQAGDKKVGLCVTEVGAGSATGGSSLNRGKDGQAKLLTDSLQVLHQEAQLVQRPGGRLVQLAGPDDEHLRLVQDLGPAEANGKAKPSYKAFRS